MSSPTLRVRLGCRVRELRLRQKLSLESLAEKAGLNDKSIQAVETARQSPTIDTIEKVALGLGVNLKELFSFEDELPDALGKRASRLVQNAHDQEFAWIVRLLESELH